jgi:hypothetical protein
MLLLKKITWFIPIVSLLGSFQIPHPLQASMMYERMILPFQQTSAFRISIGGIDARFQTC